MTETVDTTVIGGGQAGLCVSHYLRRKGIEHLVLERDTIGSSWRNRWDSFTLVTPNELNLLPDHPSGGEPDGFLQRDQVIDYLEEFAASFDPPLRTGVDVTSVSRSGTGSGFRVETSEGSYVSRNVVVATGTFQHPRVPDFAAGVGEEIGQIHSAEYRNPHQLPEGGVLVVGSGQSGAQIADELRDAGRQVFLSVGRAPRLPRRYRGRDTMQWLFRLGALDRTVDMLESPEQRFAPHPHVSGRDGGKTIDLRRFASEGIKLLGRLSGADGDRLQFSDDLANNLQAADDFATGMMGTIDEGISAAGIVAPAPSEEELARGAWEPDGGPLELSLGEAGIRTIIWATGFRFDFGWVEFPVFDDFGYPIQRQGVTDCPGLYFAGLHWLHKHKSALLCGVAEGAEYVANRIADSNSRPAQRS